jgi:hypothetical protein
VAAGDRERRGAVSLAKRRGVRPGVGDDAFRDRLPGFPLAHVLVFWGGVQQQYWAFGLNPAESAAGAHCRAIVFQGDLDARVTTPQARAVYEALGGPKQYQLYPDAGHLGMRTADPDRWRATIPAFLDSLTAVL